MLPEPRIFGLLVFGERDPTFAAETATESDENALIRGHNPLMIII